MAKLNVLLMGGDTRYLEVIKKLSSEGIMLYLIGYDQLTFDEDTIVNTTVDRIDFSIIDAVCLPVAGTKDNGKIEAMYSEDEIFLTKEMISQTPNLCTIYTGTTNHFLDDIADTCNRQLVALFARDELAIYNSIPTAEGALMLAIEHTDFTIHGSDIMVLGFGRVGKTIARLFSSIGANVSVAVRKPADFARITEMGLTAIYLENLEMKTAGINIFVNTIPQPMIDSKLISVMEDAVLIIDIASASGGTDFVSAEKRGIKALHALGLPGKTAPKSAGRIIGNVLHELLRK